MAERLLITGARAPAALHLARLCHAAGHHVVLADSLKHPSASFSMACRRYVVLPSPSEDFDAYKDTVRRTVKEHGISLVLPTCEEVFYLARIWKDGDISARLMAPDLEQLQAAHNKFGFIEQCRTFDLDVPETHLLESASDIARFKRDADAMVFKPVWSRFGTDVLVRPKGAQLDRVSPSAHEPWIAQTYVSGEEICVYAFARNGVLTAFSAYQPTYRAGQGAGIYFEPATDDGARQFVEAYVAGAGWTGQIAFDLMRTSGGPVLPLECNPRATSGIHFFREPDAFCDALLGGHGEVKPDVFTPQTIHLAMWIFAFPFMVVRGEKRRFFSDLRRADDLLDWPSDPPPRRLLWRPFLEIAGRALRNRTGLQAASTYDIEWNGRFHNSN